MSVASRLFLCTFTVTILIGVAFSSPLGNLHSENIRALSSTGQVNEINSATLNKNTRNMNLKYDSVDAELNSYSPRSLAAEEYADRWDRILGGSKDVQGQTNSAEKRSSNLLVTLQRNFCCRICQGDMCVCCRGG